jgi:hemoglobin
LRSKNHIPIFNLFTSSRTIMKKTILIASMLLGLSNAAFAQSMNSSAALYQAFGEKAGLVKLMDDFVPRLQADPRLAEAFKKANVANLKSQLVDQICQVSGGPCEYKGPDMKAAHSNMDITKTDFNALVEVLQKSMDAQGIAFSSQNQLLAKLAPMHRDVITVK